MVPRFEAKARPQFLRGDFEAAALLAMKEVEVRVRALSGLDDSLVGRTLMQEAFKPPGDSGAPGALHQPGLDPGEAVPMVALFKGAIGTFKNPASHRRVNYNDPTEAAEVILLADLLMRLLAKLPT